MSYFAAMISLMTSKKLPPDELFIWRDGKGRKRRVSIPLYSGKVAIVVLPRRLAPLMKDFVNVDDSIQVEVRRGLERPLLFLRDAKSGG